MAHIRTRHIESHISKLLRYSPIVGILGHRQVGKTTLLEQLSRGYVTLDTSAELALANSSPDSFVDRFTAFPTGIDECQLSPALFPALKDRVRRVKRPGQFLLTGSVRFTSRKAIKESLTGRIVNVDIHPLMITELLGLREPWVASHILESKDLDLGLPLGHKVSSDKIEEAGKTLQRCIKAGGLPGVCFVRDQAIRAQKLESQIETILARDLRLLIETTLSFETLRRLLSILALQQGSPLEFVDLSRRSRISVPALRRLIEAFEALFLIWRLPCEGGEKRPTIFFEDSGEAYHLAEGRASDLEAWSSTVIAQVRSVFDIPLSGSEGMKARLSQYRTRSGVYIPLVVRRGKNSLGIIPILDDQPTPSELGSSRSFLSAVPNSKVLFVHPTKASQQLTTSSAIVSGGLLLL